MNHVLFVSLAVCGLCSIPLRDVHECWTNHFVHPPLLAKPSIQFNSKYKFSFEEASGEIFDMKRDEFTPYYIGDFSTVRVTDDDNKISIFEGLVMRPVVPAPHIIDQTEETLEIQIIHKMLFGIN